MTALQYFFHQVKRSVVMSRPILWTGPVLFYLSAVWFSHLPWNTAVYIGLLCMTYPFGFIVMAMNDLSDMHYDRNNPRKGGLQGAVLDTTERHWVKRWIVAFAVTIVVICALFNLLAAGYLVLLIVLAAAYSFPPARLKNLPIIDTASNMFGAYLIWGFGYASLYNQVAGVGEVSPAGWALIGGAGLIHALGAVLDRAVDEKAHEVTTATFFGENGAFAFAFLYLGALLVYLRPVNLLLHGYISVFAVSCAYIVATQKWKLMHALVWMVEFVFPAVLFLLCVFSPEYMRILLTP